MKIEELVGSLGLWQTATRSLARFGDRRPAAMDHGCGWNGLPTSAAEPSGEAGAGHRPLGRTSDRPSVRLLFPVPGPRPHPLAGPSPAPTPGNAVNPCEASR
jgi:hypothetical protein